MGELRSPRNCSSFLIYLGEAHSIALKWILFVCVENTFRSILSEAIFNAHARKGWAAQSAGVQPAKAINPVAVELLQEIGIQINPKTPELVTPRMIARARRVITFGCLDRCPIGAKNKSEDWSIPGATGKTPQELRAIRDELRRRMLSLIEEISH
jgi:protein-tyrosine-phosphatase